MSIQDNADYKIIDEQFTSIANKVYSLKDRWADEREYEDFADYKKNLVEYFKTQFDMTLTGVTKTFKLTFSSGLEVKFPNSGRVSFIL